MRHAITANPTSLQLDPTMKLLTTSLLAVVLLATADLAHAAPNCMLKLTGDDRMQFNLKTATVSASCATINIELTHVGKMPVLAMGHNVVISATKDLSAVAAAGMKAGAAAAYTPKGDPRVIAATPLAGGGATVRSKFVGSKLKAGGDYNFYCTFPGHSSIMKGKLVVIK